MRIIRRKLNIAKHRSVSTQTGGLWHPKQWMPPSLNESEFSFLSFIPPDVDRSGGLLAEINDSKNDGGKKPFGECFAQASGSLPSTCGRVVAGGAEQSEGDNE